MKCLLPFIGIFFSTSALHYSIYAKADSDGIRKMINDGALVIDVRTVDEFSRGHYPSTINIPVDVLAEHLQEIGPADRLIVVYCRSGRRSEKAKQILESLGYLNVTDAGAFADMPEK